MSLIAEIFEYYVDVLKLINNYQHVLLEHKFPFKNLSKYWSK